MTLAEADKICNRNLIRFIYSIFFGIFSNVIGTYVCYQYICYLWCIVRSVDECQVTSYSISYRV
jgi:hypothetical protein